MDRFDLVAGCVYVIKKSDGGYTRAKFICVTYIGQRQLARYHFTNLKTNREIVLRSKTKIREEVKE